MIKYSQGEVIVDLTEYGDFKSLAGNKLDVTNILKDYIKENTEDDYILLSVFKKPLTIIFKYDSSTYRTTLLSLTDDQLILFSNVIVSLIEDTNNISFLNLWIGLEFNGNNWEVYLIQYSI